MFYNSHYRENHFLYIDYDQMKLVFNECSMKTIIVYIPLALQDAKGI